MPSNKHINYTYETCHPCKWFRQRLYRSGLHPIYDSLCEHPSQLRESVIYGETGTVIGKNTDERPGWCPIRGDAKAEKEAKRDWLDEDDAPTLRLGGKYDLR